VVRIGVAEEQLQLSLLEVAIDHREVGRHLARQLRVTIGQPSQLDQVAGPRLQARPGLELAAQLGGFAGDAARARGIVPDARGG
jgi:hypothetical protein